MPERTRSQSETISVEFYDELAAELEVSHQALSERLRRANKVLANEQFDELENDGLVQQHTG